MEQENKIVNDLVELSNKFDAWDNYLRDLLHSARDGQDFMKKFKECVDENYTWCSELVQKDLANHSVHLTIRVMDVMYSVIDAIGESVPILEDCDSKAYVYSVASSFIGINKSVISARLQAVTVFENLFNGGDSLYDN